MYDEVLKKQPNFVFALNNRGVVLANLEHNEQALKWYDKALETIPRRYRYDIKQSKDIGNKSGKVHRCVRNTKSKIRE